MKGAARVVDRSEKLGANLHAIYVEFHGLEFRFLFTMGTPNETIYFLGPDPTLYQPWGLDLVNAEIRALRVISGLMLIQTGAQLAISDIDIKELSFDALRGILNNAAVCEEVYREYGHLFIPGDWMLEFRQMTERAQERFMRLKATIDPDGYVYIVRSVTGHYKIGRSVDPMNRIKTFEVKLPFEIEYEFVIASADYKALEATLHERFADQRVDGEWFDLTDDDIADLRREYADLLVDF